MISEIEILLKEIEKLEGRVLKNKRNEFVRKLIQVKDLSSTNFSPEILFNQNNSFEQKKFFAACLLRLLCHNDNSIWEDVEFRQRTFNLFDELFFEVYAILKISPNTENHVKLSRLKDLEQKMLKDFEAITEDISSLKTAIDSQTKIMKALKKPIHKLFLDNFIDSHLTSETRLKELFDNLKYYEETSGISRMEVYQDINKVFFAYIEDLNRAYSSDFLVPCLKNPFSKIQKLINDDFDKSDIIKPAEVRLLHPSRKYPFHKIGEKVELKFVIKNDGLGYAFDVQIDILAYEGLILESDDLIRFREIKVESLDIVIPVIFSSTANYMPSLFIRWSWQNYSNNSVSKEEIFEFESQKEDINWDILKRRRPYSLQAVETEEELVGREELVENIYTNLVADTIESAVVCGQKRVGKTSIAKTLANKLKQEDDFISIFIKAGDLDKTTSTNFIKTLGEAIVEETLYHHKLNTFEIEKPIFKDVLSPQLASFFRKIKRLAPKLKFIIVIDEFDEIPNELYRYTDVGNNFFHNIRSLSQEGGQIGFILIGGENMQIISQSTDRLNLFTAFPVDYFNKERFFGDFKNLIRQPLQGIFEFSDESVDEIYELTEGNPFFTKFICDKLFKQACDRKDAYISIDETKQAIIDSIEALDTINVNHFWIDGIWENQPERYDQIQTQRRKFLIAYAEIKRCKGKVERQEILKSKILQDIAIDSMIEGFINRGILLEKDGCFRLKPKLFDEWLVQKGSQLLTTSFSDANAIEELKSKEEQAYVNNREIVSLTEKWESYQHKQITPTHVKAWLEQFQDNLERRLMFKLLQKIKFYSGTEVQDKLRIIHNFVKSDMSFSLKEGEKQVRNIREILLSSFGELSKSGSTYAHAYAKTNSIFKYNTAFLLGIPQFLEEDNIVSTLVFVDDVIGTGKTIIDGLQILNKTCGELIASRNIKVVVASICGLESGKEAIEVEANKLNFNVEVFVCDLFDESNRCFTDESLIFADKIERKKAKEVALKYGTRLDKKQPLGYDGGQLLIVFHDTCPNNSLPILWSSLESSWIPLFRRHL